MVKNTPEELNNFIHYLQTKNSTLLNDMCKNSECFDPYFENVSYFGTLEDCLEHLNKLF